MEMVGKSDSELARIIKREGGLKGGAAIQKLKSRGYGEESIKDMVRNA
ncbi:MAG: hypothetical protein KH259_07725 [Haemophilus paraphrohaemolyticus]|nr:hypothetical protein [Haemophilus paraphrohaemolyticus]